MDDILVIARSTASRVLHVKSLYFLLAIGIALMASGQLYDDITAGRQQEYAMDLGLLMISLVGILGALVACFDLPRELREKTMVTLLSKPLGRDRYLIGKFLGICTIVVVTMGIMGGAFLILTSNAGGYRSSLEISKGLILLLAGAIQLAAVGVLMGILVREWLAAVATIVILWATYALGTAVLTAGTVSRSLYSLLPNFVVMDAKPLIANNITINWSLVGGGVLMAVLYSVAMLIIAGFVFRHKDIA